MLKTLVVIPNSKTVDYLSIVAIAKAECLKKEHGQKVAIRVIAPLLVWGGDHVDLVYVVVYENLGAQGSGVGERKAR